MHGEVPDAGHFDIKEYFSIFYFYSHYAENNYI